jgi:BlaI family transcriptional regulator, penicillinase repressor
MMLRNSDKRSTNTLPRPTDVELQILDLFWERGPITVREAHNMIESSPERSGTSYSTTLKMIQVLHEKGFLTRDASVRPQVYRTTVTREATQQRMVEDVAQRLFGGAMADLVQCAIASQDVSEEELAEMQRLIRQAKKEGRS